MAQQNTLLSQAQFLARLTDTSGRHHDQGALIVKDDLIISGKNTVIEKSGNNKDMVTISLENTTFNGRVTISYYEALSLYIRDCNFLCGLRLEHNSGTSLNVQGCIFGKEFDAFRCTFDRANIQKLESESKIEISGFIINESLVVSEIEAPGIVLYNELVGDILKAPYVVTDSHALALQLRFLGIRVVISTAMAKAML
jgi:hypothetical protein